MKSSRAINSIRYFTETYCHYQGLSWRTIMGSGFDGWIYKHFFTIKMNYNSSQSKTVWLAPFLTGLRVSSLPLWRMKNLSRMKYAERQSQSYFTTGGVPPISLSWCQTPWDSWRDFFFNWTLTVIVRLFVAIPDFRRFTEPLPSNGHNHQNILTNVTYSSKAYIITDSKLSDDYISPFHKFTGPTCYYWLQDIIKYGAGVASSSIMSISNLVKMGQWILYFK
jgi:hypothetical protein